jgi:hypothetical protein
MRPQPSIRVTAQPPPGFNRPRSQPQRRFGKCRRGDGTRPWASVPAQVVRGGSQFVDELVSRNVASLPHIPTPPKRRRKGSAWSVEEASQFLQSARDDHDPLYAGYVLTLVLALRKGEVLGLPWETVDSSATEIDVSWQLQRIRGQLIHKKRTKANDDQSGDVLPLPDICLVALVLSRAWQDADKKAAGERWKPAQLSPSGVSSGDLVFTTRTGTNRDPRNFNCSFDIRCDKAGVRRIR